MRQNEWEKEKKKWREKNMKKRKDKRADIANVKSRKMRKMVTQLLSEDVFIIVFFSVYINSFYSRYEARPFRYFLPVSFIAFRLRDVHKIRKRSRYYGSLLWEYRGAYDAWFYEACYSYSFCENFIDFFRKYSFYDIWRWEKRLPLLVPLILSALNFLKSSAKKFVACKGKRSGKFDVVHACRLRSFTYRPLWSYAGYKRDEL